MPQLLSKDLTKVDSYVVRVRDGKKRHVRKAGKITLTFIDHCRHETNPRILNDLLHIRDFEINLILVNKKLEKGYDVHCSIRIRAIYN